MCDDVSWSPMLLYSLCDYAKHHTTGKDMASAQWTGDGEEIELLDSTETVRIPAEVCKEKYEKLVKEFGEIHGSTSTPLFPALLDQYKDQALSNVQENRSQLKVLHDFYLTQIKRLEDGEIPEEQLDLIYPECLSDPTAASTEDMILTMNKVMSAFGLSEPQTAATLPATKATKPDNIRSTRRSGKRSQIEPKTTDESMSEGDSTRPNTPASVVSEDREKEQEHLRWKKSIMVLHKAIAGHRSANMFLSPVTERMAPNYNDIIYRPTDLKTIHRHIDEGFITSTTDFTRHIYLMFINAIFYNERGSVVHQAAKEMFSHAQTLIDEYRMTVSNSKQSITLKDLRDKRARSRDSRSEDEKAVSDRDKGRRRRGGDKGGDRG